MGENIKNGRKYLILGQNLISSPIFNILPHYEKPGVKFASFEGKIIIGITDRLSLEFFGIS
jgi:hypothetical protein